MHYCIMRKCKKCGLLKPESKFYLVRLTTRKPWKNHRCKSCTLKYQRVRASTWYRAKHLQVQKNYHRKLKRELIEAYGGKCACCGEDRFEFLQVDHINGGGGKHIRSLTTHMSLHLKQLGYPKDLFRLLCANCNFSRGIYGYCPHTNENNN